MVTVDPPSGDIEELEEEVHINVEEFPAEVDFETPSGADTPSVVEPVTVSTPTQVLEELPAPTPTTLQPEATRARALSASRHPLPSSTPVQYTPPLPNPTMVEVTTIPMPLINNFFVLQEMEKVQAIKLCGNALAEMSKGDFVLGRESFLLYFLGEERSDVM